MALALYTAPSSTSKVSEGDFTNPFAITFDGRTGGSKQVKLYVRNDDALVYYTDITVKAEDLTDDIVNNEADGFYWKFIAGDTEPTQADWSNTPVANTITLSDIGGSGSPDTSTYLPFWVQISIPHDTDVQLFDNAQVILIATENTV